MGKATGFIDFPRVECPSRPAAERVRDYGEFHGALQPDARREQAGRCMNCGVPFCQVSLRVGGEKRGCPLGNLIPEWNDLAWLGNLPLALARLLKTNCFPEFTGRVCPAPCERACACREASGFAVTIRDNELSIVEAAWASGYMKPRPPEKRSGCKVAVVGSGPAGLACAWWLNRRGHEVTVYERSARPGGLLTYGIPNMKLPQEVVERRVACMEAEGVRFATGVAAESIDAIPDADSIVLCCGAQKPREVPFENSDLPGIVFALDYLGDSLRAQLGEGELSLSAEDKRVCIIGNGDTATDCVATALRQGCRSLTQLIRKPASYYPPELDYAHEEAMEVFGEVRRFETQVRRAWGELALEALTLSTPAGEEELPCDLLIIASGFSGCDEVAASLAAEAAGREGVFLAGDMAQGATLVVRALADARAVAAKVDRYLTGFTSIQ